MADRKRRASFPDTPYVIFPSNVGEATTLRRSCRRADEQEIKETKMSECVVIADDLTGGSVLKR